MLSSSLSPKVKGLFSLWSGELALQGHCGLCGKSLPAAGPCFCKFSLSLSLPPLLPLWVCQWESLGLFSCGSRLHLEPALQHLSQPPCCSSSFPWPPEAQSGVSGGSVPGHFHRQVPAPGDGAWPFLQTEACTAASSLSSPSWVGTHSDTPHPCHHCPQGCLLFVLVLPTPIRLSRGQSPL